MARIVPAGSRLPESAVKTLFHAWHGEISFVRLRSADVNRGLLRARAGATALEIQLNRISSRHLSI